MASLGAAMIDVLQGQIELIFVMLARHSIQLPVSEHAQQLHLHDGRVQLIKRFDVFTAG
jgi:hypothetical protein